ncbi:MAG: hypothetical protein U0L56_01875 [Lachnospiraceae bacterium]|nr:hypothetical protein [Lachnospiraceae bacterium]
MNCETFDSYLEERFGMNEAQFAKMLQENSANCNYDFERPEAIIACYKEKWRNKLKCARLDNKELTFLEWWESYFNLNPARFHEICVATGTTVRQEVLALDWFKKCWKQHEDLIELGQCPF